MMGHERGTIKKTFFFQNCLDIFHEISTFNVVQEFPMGKNICHEIIAENYLNSHRTHKINNK